MPRKRIANNILIHIFALTHGLCRKIVPRLITTGIYLSRQSRLMPAKFKGKTLN